MQIHVITIFPEMYRAVTEEGVTARAFRDERATLAFWNPRDYTKDAHRTVDDRPYGGGPGMVMMFEPLSRAIEAAKAAAPDAQVVCMSPQGEPLTQQGVKRFSGEEAVVLLPGRYEGIDERIVEKYVDVECSIGDYVLSGGELASMVWIDAVVRCLPGVLGNAESLEQESFVNGLLDCPHYTRPERVGDLDVPEVLLGGDHGAIRRWRLKSSLGRTWLRRPDLLRVAALDSEMKALLEEFQREYTESREEQ